MAWMPEGGEPALWLPGQPFPKKLHQFVRDEYSIFCAWNAQFEIQIWNRVGTRHGFPEIPADRWHDTMGDAAMCGFPLALDQAAQALGASEQKDARGKRLINKLSKPKPGGDFWTYAEAREDYLALYEYCLQDVRVESDLYWRVPDHVRGKEDTIQRLTWLTNDRGVPVDVTSVGIIKQRLDEHTEYLDHVVQRFTDGALDSARQRDKLLFHLEMNREVASKAVWMHEVKKDAGLKPGRLFPSKIKGMKLSNLQGETVEELLKDGDVSDYDRFLLECYQDINHASVAKFKKILLQLCLTKRSSPTSNTTVPARAGMLPGASNCRTYPASASTIPKLPSRRSSASRPRPST